MNKKPILLMLFLVLVIVTAYAGFMASAPAAMEPKAVGEVRLEVTGPAPMTGSTEGQVKLVVV